MAKKKTAPKVTKFVSTRPPAFMPDPNDIKKAVQVGPQEVDTAGHGGRYRKLSDPADAPAYALKVLSEDEAEGHYGRTHHAINQEYHWSGTAEDFRKQFEKA